uniref:5'-nucleotidase domain-containing protein 1 n=1 Tax=Lepeophtheirus salmonis TaxID=72036 RepID=A0A0K2VJ39_LEPSM|nr:LOW QUALITY PROTEIN: 5'-nucleotidase domain-containing protein 1-like [Lepeophtheirus salmonis]
MPGSKRTCCIDDYDCIGFDLDHTLCRYNIGPMVRLEYDLLAEFLVTKKGYDPAIRRQTFDHDRDFICKGLTLDCERGNLLRLGQDGFILAACHGMKKLSDTNIEKIYGRCRRKHVGRDYTSHLVEFGPQNMCAFSPMLHNFMDYFDIAAPLLCARIVEIIDLINNGGKPMEEYNFWPDVQEGLRDMFTRTQFAADRGGYFPEVKANPEKYILKRRPEFRDWLKMLRQNGKFLYVITGSHYDFASHVASYALGEDWKELFDIVIFFARKPSFFVETRPFWRLDGAKEIESFRGWEDLETGEYYSQGNWRALNEFFEYCTEWEPSTSLYFGDNVLQDILAPKKFTSTVDCIAVSEELLAEGMVSCSSLIHPHSEDITSPIWGSYFFYPDSRLKKNQFVTEAATNFFKKSSAVNEYSGCGRKSAAAEEVKRAITLRRVSSLKNPADISDAAMGLGPSPHSEPVSRGVSPEPKEQSNVSKSIPKGTARINTLWGTFIRDYAKMCIPDIDVLIDYPIDFRFPAFGRDKKGNLYSGFFPNNPSSLHSSIPNS